jgi:site-specific recombinase XerD
MFSSIRRQKLQGKKFSTPLAVNLLMAGVDLESLRQLLEHSEI